MTSWVEPYIGIPFVTQGRSVEGWDCWGLCVVVYRERCGIALPSHLVDSLDGRAVRDAIKSEAPAWLPVEIGAEREMDVAVMRSIHAGGYAAESHVGLVTRPGRLMHVEEATATVCVPFDHHSIAGRVRRIYRHKDLA